MEGLVNVIFVILAKSWIVKSNLTIGKSLTQPNSILESIYLVFRCVGLVFGSYIYYKYLNGDNFALEISHATVVTIDNSIEISHTFSFCLMSKLLFPAKCFFIIDVLACFWGPLYDYTKNVSAALYYTNICDISFHLRKKMMIHF